jgi:uncharacterized phage protein gp47/JayE
VSKTPDVVAGEIIQKLKETTKNALSLELGTPERKIIDAVAEAISEAYIDQYLVGSLMDIESKAGLELEQWCGIFGFGRLQGRKATGEVRIELKNGNDQDVNLRVGNPFYTRQSLPGSINQVYFTSTQAIVIPAGSTVADVPVECTVVGTTGNVSPDSIVYVGDILGATKATNLQAFTGGVDVETDDELRQRFKNTFLRNVAGTEDWYLGLCYQNKFVSKAACFGPITKYATQLIASDDVDLASYLAQDVKYAWPGDGHTLVFKDLGQDTEKFYRNGSDFAWVSGVSPSITILDGDINDGDVVDLEFEYTTRSSRNDPLLGITNKVDLFVNGSDPYVVTERAFITAESKITDVSTDQLYRGNFTRTGAVVVQSASSLINADASEVVIEGTGNGPYTVMLTNTPTGGDFDLSIGGETTTVLPYDAAPVEVQDALIELSSVGAQKASVTGIVDADNNLIPGFYAINFTLDEAQDLTGRSFLTNANASEVSVDGDTVTLTNTPTGGTYTLIYGVQTTDPIAYDAAPSAIQAELESLSRIGAGNVTVTGTSTSYTITLDPSTKVPAIDNRFMRLGSTPITSFPSSLVIGTGSDATTYTQGIDYHLLRLAPETQNPPNSTTLMAGSIYEVVGIEWESPGPASDTAITVTYTYNRVPEILQAVVKTGKQVTTDVLVHQANYSYIRVYLSIEYNRGFTISQVDNAIQERLKSYFSGQPYGAWIEVSDLCLAVHQVLGVDNVNLTSSDELGVGTNYGLKVYATGVAGETPIITHTTDFKLTDSQLPVFLDAVIRRRANR